MQSVKDKVVMITGASSGFGEATARMLVAEGAKVVLGARREDRLKAICDDLGASATYAVCDVTDVKSVEALAAHGIKSFNRIDALVNNAGIMPLSLLQMGRVDEWDQMIDVNIKGVLYGIHSVLNHMLERGSGRIINISSVAGLVTNPGVSVYSGTKFAVKAISEGLRQETDGKIGVTCIYPGAFATELGDTIKDEMIRKAFIDRGIPELAQPPERVAEAIVYALSQDDGTAVNEITIRPLKNG